MNIDATITNLPPSAPRLLESSGQSVMSPERSQVHSQPRKPVARAYASPFPSYAITQRQQVMAYAVIDSLGRNLTQPRGDSISLNA